MSRILYLPEKEIALQPYFCDLTCECSYHTVFVTIQKDM